MTSSAALGVSIRKEARALLPMWAASMGMLIVVTVFGNHRAAEAGQILYLLGSVSLASWSIGHEYTYGTLPFLLALPSDRPRLLLVKLGVLLPMLATLAVMAARILPAFRGRDLEEFRTLIPALSLVCALTLAPLLTMVCRSPLAGVVFAAGVTSWVHMGSQLAGLIVYGSTPAVVPDRDQLTMALRLWGLVSVTALGAVAGWLAFMRLEAIDGLPDVHWPHAWRRTATSTPAARRRNPFWLLALKELRLQQMTFILVGLFIVSGAVFSMLRAAVPDLNDPLEPLEALAVLDGLLLAWLIGSLASAEERHLGTLASQTLLPIAAWQQWLVKAGVAIGLAILVGSGLPIVLGFDGPLFNPSYIGTIVVVVIASLYVSTLCSSGLRTLTVSGPAILVVFLPLGRLIGPFDADLRSPLGGLVLIGLLLLALRFGFENHRSAERDVKRVARQLLVMAAVPLLALIAKRF